MDTEAFFAAIRGSNPFSATRVNSPGESVLTVKEIHGKEFQELCNCCELVLQNGRALGVLLLGNAGVGKSHLLARLRQWSAADNRALYIYLHNVMASPDSMPRHFLRSIVSQLASTRESNKDSLLYGLIHSLMKSLRKSGAFSGKVISISRARAAFRERTAAIDLRADRLSAAVFEVLFTYYADVNMNPLGEGSDANRVRSIVDWLSGDGISDDAAEAIGIPADRRQYDDEGLVRLRDDHDVEQVLLALAGLTQASDKILLVCLDQFDNLSPEQVQPFVRFTHALLDHAKSLILVTAGVSETILKFRESQIISEAQWDRLAERQIDLHLIPRRQAEDLLRVRLEPIQAWARTEPALATLLEKHSIFPIGEAEFEKRFGEAIELRPRSIVKWADEIWRSEQERLNVQGGAKWLETWSSTPIVERGPQRSMNDVIDETVARALNEKIAELRDSSGGMLLDADNLATVTHRLLDYCRNCDRSLITEVVRMENDRPCHLVLRSGAAGDSSARSTAVLFITERDGRTARGPLARLLGYSDVSRRVLVTDENEAPLPMTTTIAAAYDELSSAKSIPFLHYKLNYQQRVELESLRCVIEDAQNITIEFPLGSDRSLPPTEVAESLFRQRHLLSHPLLSELISQSPLSSPANDASVQQPAMPSPVPPNAIETVIHGNLS